VEIRIPPADPARDAPGPEVPPALLPHEPVRGAAALAELQARRPPAGRGRLRAALPLAAWFAVCLVIFADTLHGGPGPGAVPRGWGRAFLAAAYPAAVWTIFLWVALRVTRRTPVGGRRWARAAARHLAAGVGLGVAAWLSRLGARVLDGEPAGATLREALAVVGGNFVVYAALAGTAHALEYARRVRAKEVTDLRLRAELSESELQRTRAELQLLKLELNPHFLFNALHTVSALLFEDVERAHAVLRRVGDLLRLALDGAGQQEVGLQEELAFLRAYLDVERHRLGERLRVEWEVEGATLGALVPHMVLQPLVENAVKHGLGGRAGEGMVRVCAARDGDVLVLAVEDDGAGVAPGPRQGAGSRGVGVANTRARLAQMHGPGGTFVLHPRPGGGTRAEVRLPFVTEAHATPFHPVPEGAHA
jgi:signal transduction histidine kinase